MSILAGTDFSPAAGAAVDLAARLARSLGCTLVLLHVVEERPRGGDRVGRRVRREARVRLLAEGERLRRAGVAVEEVLQRGDPAELLASVADPAEAELLVVGATGRGLPSRFFVGSTAERAVTIAPAPVLVVRQGERFGPWLAGRRPLRLLAAVDGSEPGFAPLDFTRWLARAGPCDVRVLQLVEPRPGSRALAEVRGALARRARVALPAGSDLEARVLARTRRTDLEVVEEAERIDADLVAVGSHRRTGLGRVLEGTVSGAVLARTAASVAVVPLDLRLPWRLPAEAYRGAAP